LESLIETLVQRAQEGDQEAFAELVRRHYGMVHGIALGRTSNWQAAEETVHVEHDPVFTASCAKCRGLLQQHAASLERIHAKLPRYADRVITAFSIGTWKSQRGSAQGLLRSLVFSRSIASPESRKGNESVFEPMERGSRSAGCALRHDRVTIRGFMNW